MSKSKAPERIVIDAEVADLDLRREHLWCATAIAAVGSGKFAPDAAAIADGVLESFDERRVDRISFGPVEE